MVSCAPHLEETSRPPKKPREALGDLHASVVMWCSACATSDSRDQDVLAAGLGILRCVGGGVKMRSQLGDGRLKDLLYLPGSVFILVRMSRPKKPFETVFFPAWYDVDMQMGHALTHTVIDSDERAFSAQTQFDSLCDELRICEEGGHKSSGEVHQRLIVLFWNEKTMARK